MLDAATEQWAIEKNKKNGADTPTAAELKAYVKDNSPMYSALAANKVTDTLGNVIAVPVLGTKWTVSPETKAQCLSVTDDVFWSPYE